MAQKMNNEKEQVLDSLRRKQKQIQDDLRHLEAVIRLSLKRK